MEPINIDQKRQSNHIEYNKAKRMQFIREKRMNSQEIDCLPSYLKNNMFPQPIRQAIIASLRSAIPYPLPQACTSTISYYRKSNTPVYLTVDGGSTNPHIIYESIWMLTTANESAYQDYVQVAKHFEQHLHEYLQSPYAQIQEVAIIAAGNKVLGKPEVISQFASTEHFWVYANHLEEGRVSHRPLFSEILKNNEKAYKCLYDISSMLDNDLQKNIICDLMNEENSDVLFHLVSTLFDNNNAISLDSLKIVGNILNGDQSFVDELIKYDITKELTKILQSAKRKKKQLVCWAICNIASGTTAQSTGILHNTQLMVELVRILQTDVVSVKMEVLRILSGIINKAETMSVFRFLQDQRLFACLSHVKSDTSLQQACQQIVNDIVQLVRRQLSAEEVNQYLKRLSRYGFQPDLDQMQLN